YDFKVHGQFSDATLQLIADLAATHTVLNTCLYLFKRATPPQFARRVERFQRAISTFVIAHEFGHIFAGDLNAHPATTPSNSDSLRRSSPRRRVPTPSSGRFSTSLDCPCSIARRLRMKVGWKCPRPAILTTTLPRTSA